MLLYVIFRQIQTSESKNIVHSSASQLGTMAGYVLFAINLYRFVYGFQLL